MPSYVFTPNCENLSIIPWNGLALGHLGRTIINLTHVFDKGDFLHSDLSWTIEVLFFSTVREYNKTARHPFCDFLFVKKS